MPVWSFSSSVAWTVGQAIVGRVGSDPMDTHGMWYHGFVVVGKATGFLGLLVGGQVYVFWSLVQWLLGLAVQLAMPHSGRPEASGCWVGWY